MCIGGFSVPCFLFFIFLLSSLVLLPIIIIIIIASSVVTIVVCINVHRIHVAIALAIGRATGREVAVAGIFCAGCCQLPFLLLKREEGERAQVVSDAGETGARRQGSRECLKSHGST